MPKTTQQSISPIHPTITTPHNIKKTPFPQATIQSTVTPSAARNIHKWITKHMDH